MSPPDAKPESDRYLVLAFLWLVAVISYVQRSALSVPAKEIATDLHFGSLGLSMGVIQWAWYFAYAILQIPSGWFADRVGSRRALATLCVLWSIATLMSGFARDFYSLLVLWAIMGAAQAGAFPCAAKAIGQLFPETKRARASGMLAAGMMIGGAVSASLTGKALVSLAPTAATLGWERWRLVFGLYAVPGLLWVMLFLAVVSADRLPFIPRSLETHRPVKWTRLMSSSSMQLLCAQQFFRAAGMVFFMTWFPTFLQKTRGVSTELSGYMTTVAGIGAVIGSLTGGVVSDWMLNKTGNSRLSRQGIAVVGMGSCAVLIVISYFLTHVWSSIAVISLGAFCATFGGVSGYTVAIKFGGKQVATVFSTMNMCGNIGASLFPLVAGALAEKYDNWNQMLFLFAGIMAVDAVCWAFLNPHGTLFDDDHDDAGNNTPGDDHDDDREDASDSLPRGSRSV